MAQKIQVTAELKDNVSRGLQTMSQNVQGTNRSFGTMAGTVKTLATAFVGLAAVQKTLAFGKESIAAAEKQVQAVQKLSNAVGYSTTGLTKYASALQKVTTFGDEVTIEAMAMVGAFIKEEDTIKRLMPAIQDLAAAKGMDLVSAADLVTKSVASETNALSRYGIQIDGAAGSVERATSAVEQLNKAFGGTAQALADTDFGKITQMKNEIGDMQEELGITLVPLVKEWYGAILGVARAYETVYGVLYNIGAGKSKEFTIAQRFLKETLPQINDAEKQRKAVLKEQGELYDELNRKQLLQQKQGGSMLGRAMQGDIDKLKEAIGVYEEYLVAAATTSTAAPPPVKPGPSEDELARRAKIGGMLSGEDDPRIKAMAEQSELEASMQADALKRLEEHNKHIMQLDADKAEADAYGMDQMRKNQLETEKALTKEEALRKKLADEEQNRQQQRLDNMAFFAGAAESMANDAVALGLATKEQMKPILIASAIADGAGAAVAGLRAVWNTAASAGPAGAYVGAALSAAVLGQVGLSTAVQVKKIQSAATGADFVATEPQLMLVGDNPGSQGERVQVTPNGSNNLNGPQGGGGGATININITGGQSPQATGRELAKAIKMLHVQGLL